MKHYLKEKNGGYDICIFIPIILASFNNVLPYLLIIIFLRFCKIINMINKLEKIID